MNIEVKSDVEIRITPETALEAATLRNGGEWTAKVEHREPFALGADELVLKAEQKDDVEGS